MQRFLQFDWISLASHFLQLVATPLAVIHTEYNLDQHSPMEIVQNDKITIKLTNRFVATHTSRFFLLLFLHLSFFGVAIFFFSFFYDIIWMVLNSTKQETLSSLASNQSVYRRDGKKERHNAVSNKKSNNKFSRRRHRITHRIACRLMFNDKNISEDKDVGDTHSAHTHRTSI